MDLGWQGWSRMVHVANVGDSRAVAGQHWLKCMLLQFCEALQAFFRSLSG